MFTEGVGFGVRGREDVISWLPDLDDSSVILLYLLFHSWMHISCVFTFSVMCGNCVCVCVCVRACVCVRVCHSGACHAWIVYLV